MDIDIKFGIGNIGRKDMAVDAVLQIYYIYFTY